jgi:hypothetical protein
MMAKHIPASYFVSKINAETELKIQYNHDKQGWESSFRGIKSESIFSTDKEALIDAIQCLCKAFLNSDENELFGTTGADPGATFNFVDDSYDPFNS